MHAHECALVQVSGDTQLPQVSVPPQPFEITPHSAPCAAQVVGVQLVSQ